MPGLWDAHVHLVDIGEVAFPAVRINAPHTTTIAIRREAMPAIVRQMRDAR